MSKICNHCKKDLPEEKYRKKNGTLYYICKDCERIYNAAWRNKNREHVNKKALETNKRYRERNKENLKTKARENARKRLNIDPKKFRGPNQLERGQTKYNRSQIDKMSRYGLTPEQFDSLPVKCEVCGSTFRLCIDHNHATGAFRGVLCHNCNLALGHLHDDPDIIIKLLNYLKERQK